MLLMSVFVLIVSWFQITNMALFAERVGYKAKVAYFRACLQKDGDFYDANPPTEMASRISKEVSAIQRAIGEKFGNIIMSVASFFLGYAFSFWWGWILSLILLGGLPIMICVGVALGVAVSGGVVEQLKAYAQSAGYAEQALNAVRIVHTYCNEKLEHKNYLKYLERAKKAQFKFTIIAAAGGGFLFFAIQLLYGGAFWFGGWLRINKIKEGDEEYTGGKVIAIMFSIIFGAFNLGGMAPHVKALTEGKIAGKLAYDTIDFKPKVDPNDKGTVLNPKTVQGYIEFRNVDFSYPTRAEDKVLK